MASESGGFIECIPDEWSPHQKIRAFAAHVVSTCLGTPEAYQNGIRRAWSMSEREAWHFGWYWVGPEKPFRSGAGESL